MKTKRSNKIVIWLLCCVISFLSTFNTSVSAGGYPYVLHLESPDTRYLYNGANIEHVFTAPVTGEYEIFTTSTIDTYGRLLQGHDEIAYDDDLGENYNFSIKCSLTGGVKYRIFVRGYLDDTVGNYTLTAKLVTETFCLRNIWQNKYLTATSTTGLNVGAFSRNQRLLWDFNSRNGGFYTLISNYYRSQFSQYTALTANNASTNLQSFNITDNQSFEMVLNSDDTYRIMHDNLALTVNNSSGSTGYGTEVILATYTGGSNQKWSKESFGGATLGGVYGYGDGIYCDFSTWIDEDSKENAKKIAGLSSTNDVTILTDATDNEVIETIKDSYYFVISTHGSRDSIQCYTPQEGHTSLTTGQIEVLSDGYFDGTKCVLINGCSTGQGAEQDSGNMANTLRRKGVQIVVGFQEPLTYCYYTVSGNNFVCGDEGCDLFSREFTKQLANGETVEQAKNAAISKVGRTSWDLYGIQDFYGTDSCYVAGNENAIINRIS